MQIESFGNQPCLEIFEFCQHKLSGAMEISNLACIIFHDIQELLICKSGFNLGKTLQKHLHSPDSDSKTFAILNFANVKSQKTNNF